MERPRTNFAFTPVDGLDTLSGRRKSVAPPGVSTFIQNTQKSSMSSEAPDLLRLSTRTCMPRSMIFQKCCSSLLVLSPSVTLSSIEETSFCDARWRADSFRCHPRLQTSGVYCRRLVSDRCVDPVTAAAPGGFHAIKLERCLQKRVEARQGVNVSFIPAFA